MNRYLAASLVVLSGCASLPQRTDGCTRVQDPRAPAGFTVYSCPHPFMVAVLDWGGSPSGVTTTKMASGITNCADRVIAFYEVYPEVLAHEYRHAARCSSGGGKD